jgi:hypothetical protein
MKYVFTLLLAATSAHAELKQETKPFTLHCQGAAGAVTMVSTPEKISY